MSTFTWKPSTGASVSNEPRIKEAKFGDGYIQRMPDGINNDPKSWNLTFSKLDKYDADQLYAFLRAAKGSIPFTWVDLDGETLQYVCPTYSRDYADEDVFNITARFNQTFG